MAQAFITWIVDDVLPPLPGELANVASAISMWITDTAASVVTWELAMSQAFITWIADDVLPALPGELASVASAISSWISSTASSIAGWAADMGAQLIAGFISGLGNLGSAIQGSVNSAVASIHMPSLPSIPMPSVPGFASGTDFAPGGLSMVGEAGPELVNLPRGSQVVPHNQVGGAAIDYARLAQALAAQPIIVEVDGKSLASVTRKQMLKIGVRNGDVLGGLAGT